MSTRQRLFEIISKLDPNFNISINKQLMNRIPFLKEYNVFVNTPDRLDAQKITNNVDHVIFFGQEMVTFKQYNLVSEVSYTKHQIRDNIFYNFSVKNSFYYDIPKELDNLTIMVYVQVVKMMSEKLSYHKEIRLNESETFNSTLLSEVVNDMNKTIYEFEEYANKYNLKF